MVSCTSVKVVAANSCGAALSVQAPSLYTMSPCFCEEPMPIPIQPSAQFSMQLGDIQISRIVEMETPFMEPLQMFPDATTEQLSRHRSWMQPWALCPATGKIIIAIQTYVIRTRHHVILVDTCLGCNKTNAYFPEWHQRSDRTWYHSLLAQNLRPE